MARARIWTVEELSYLGMTPDSRLAKYLGVGHNTVAKRRKALNIRPYRSTANKRVSDPLSALRRGLMIKVGKILVKRCPRCLVAWPLAEFVSSNRTTTGCKGPCATCRGVKKFEE